MEEGFDALTYQLDLYKNGKSSNTTGNETLLEAMKIYAPKKDNNNPTEYANNVAKSLGITTGTKIKDIDSVDWAAVISSVESPQAHKELKRLGLI